MKRARSIGLAIVGALALSACASTPAPAPLPPDPRIDAISAVLMRDIAVLASDDFAGRKPGTDGEEKTLSYLQNGFEEAGFVAGSDDYGWRLPVSLPSRHAHWSEAHNAGGISYNLLGKLPGARPETGAILLLGHWDGYGTCGKPEDADRICNGAVDNASGLAAMLELARRLSASGPHDRDIYVLATTAEEQGLVGARSFAANPPFPLQRIVAAFNFDSVAIAPRGSAVGLIGEGRTALDNVIREAIADAGLELGRPGLPRRFLKRQDGWALLEAGVPAVLLSSAFGNETAMKSYLRTRYHRANDEIGGMELGGAVQDLLLHEILVNRIADAQTYPAIAK
jgi:hypothetical protein